MAADQRGRITNVLIQTEIEKVFLHHRKGHSQKT